MPSITFGSRAEANEVRDIPAVAGRLAPGDDRRSRTVELGAGTPDRILERLENRALQSQRVESRGRGLETLTDRERESLRRGHRRFSWQQHGLEAMRVKAALAAQGVTEWQDYYEPGEGVPGAFKNLEASKGRSASTGASIGVGGMRTDEEELVDYGRRGRQAERAQAAGVDRAKEPALLELDPGAQEFLEEELTFGVDVWDIAFSEGNGGMVVGSGHDFELLEEVNARRSPRAQLMDRLLAAPKTRDPIAWANDPAHLDFPGIDTVDPVLVHERRSERARAADEGRAAPITFDAEEWADAPDQLDYPGVDGLVADALEVFD